MGGSADDLHRRVVHVHVRELNFRVLLLVHLRDDLLPQLAHLQDVGLLHGAQSVASLLRRLEPDASDALNLGDGVDHGVETGAVAGLVRAEALGLAEVDASDEFADDHDVGALDDFALEGGRVDELGEDVGWAKVGEDAEARAEAEETLLGPLVGGEGIPLVAADGGEEDGVGGLARGEGLGGQGHAGGVDRGAAHEALGEVEGDVPLGADLDEDFLRDGHDLGADAVAGEEGDLVVLGRGGDAEGAARAGHGHPDRRLADGGGALQGVDAGGRGQADRPAAGESSHDDELWDVRGDWGGRRG